MFEVVGPADFRARQTNDNPAGPVRAPVGKAPSLVGALGGQGLDRLMAGLNGLSTLMFATLSAGLFLGMFWLLGGFSALGALPPAKAEASSFAIADMFTEVQDANGMKLAVVAGVLTNESGRNLAPPNLLVATASGTRIGVIEPAVGTMEAGASVRFAGRFRIAGGKSTDLVIIPQSR